VADDDARKTIPTSGEKGLLVACEDGTVALLDASGQVLRATTVEGRPVQHALSQLDSDDGPVAILGLDSGVVVGLAIWWTQRDPNAAGSPAYFLRLPSLQMPANCCKIRQAGWQHRRHHGVENREKRAPW
jgi:hypothetical protein